MCKVLCVQNVWEETHKKTHTKRKKWWEGNEEKRERDNNQMAKGNALGFKR